MRVTSRAAARKVEPTMSCTIWEYDISRRPNTSLATAEINGRYPEKGWARNTAVTEVAYVTSGNGYIHNPEEPRSIAGGDQIIINPGEWFAWEGELELVLCCNPAWGPNQYEHRKE